MPVGLSETTELLPVKGITLSSCSANIYENNRHDMALVEIPVESSFSCVFTTNRFCAAPIKIAKSHLQQSSPRYLLINAGNANAGTGERGENDAATLCRALSEIANCELTQVLPFSTGVIGEFLPVSNMRSVLPNLIENLSETNWSHAAKAIMTTDTVSKAISKSLLIDDKEITISGMCKGSGMIRPDMATMLAYIATDAAIDSSLLQELLTELVNQSFNRITVDGDMSTNDACVLIASGKAGNPIIKSVGDNGYQLLYEALLEIFSYLAKTIVRDGEGASKFVSITVKNALTNQDSLKIAYQIASSPLVKTALTASDANWGRILAAIGSANVTSMDIKQVDIFLGDICIVRNGERASEYSDDQGQTIMQNEEISILVDMKLGESIETVWTSDLSHEYIRINAEYRT